MSLRRAAIASLCYFHHTSGSRVVACYAWKRVR
jgi:hypothetical protein